MIRTFSLSVVNKWKMLLLVIVLASIFANISVLNAGEKYDLTVNFSYNEEPVSGAAHWRLSSDNGNKSRVSGETVKSLNPGPYTINIIDVPEGYEPHDDVSISIGSSNLTVTIEILKSGSTESGKVLNWPLWPTTPTGYEGSIVFDPLSFTIVGSDKKLLSWAESLPNGVNLWNGNIYLSDLEDNVVYDAITSQDAVFDSRSLKYIISSGSQGSPIDGIDTSVLKANAIIPEYVEDWQNINSTDISNQYYGFEDEWADFLMNKKGSSNSYLGDPGHCSTVLIWPENAWLSKMSGYSGGTNPYKSFLNNVWSDDHVGDALLCISTNEGLIHGFGTDSFVEKWALMPPPALQHALYQEHLQQINGSYPRLNLLDGPLGFGDIESSDGTWRRIIVGSSGTGQHLVNKPKEAWEKENSSIANEVDTMKESYVRNNPHSWGMYAVKIAENDDAHGDGTGPASPKLLWSVGNSYWEEISGDQTLEKQVLAINDIVLRDTGSIGSSNHSEFSEILLTNCRPVVGFTESRGIRTWHVIFAAIDQDDNFNLYDVEANTGEIINVIPLGQPPYIAMNGLFDPEDYDDPTNYPSTDPNSYYFDVVWDPAFEWKFPTRIAAVAKDTVRDNDPSDLSSVQLDRRPLLKEVYVHLSNGALYQWDVSQGTSATNPRLLMVNSYEYTSLEPDEYDDNYVGSIVAGPSTQDMDGTYLEPLDSSITGEYHRFIAMAIKGGKKAKGDLRALLVIDIDQIIANNHVLSIDEKHYGHGNKDRVDYLDDYDGWFTLLAGGDASEGKYWNEGISISAPVFSNGRLILATYQPDTGASHVYNTLARPEDKYVLVDDETAYPDTEFAGGATLTLNEEGEAEIYVGTATGGVISQDLPDASWVDGLTGDSLNGPAAILYWKER